LNFLSFDVILKIFFIQLGLIVYILFSIFAHRFALKVVFWHHLWIQKKFHQLIKTALNHRKKIPKFSYWLLRLHKKQLIIALEHIKQADPSISLLELEPIFFDPFLKRFANRLQNALFWKNRYWSIRAFRLFLNKDSISKIILFLDDRKFIIKKIAAATAVEANNKNGIEKIINVISQPFLFGHLYFINVFLLESDEVFKTVLELCNEKKELTFVNNALKILALKKIKVPFSLLVPLLESEFTFFRMGVFEYLQKIPYHESLPYLIDALKENEQDVVLAAIQAISKAEDGKKIDSSLIDLLKSPFLQIRIKSFEAIYARGAIHKKDFHDQPFYLDLIRYLDLFKKN
jgi:hypothetical protein